MILVKLSGGIGNQMFQYALGKHLAIKHKTKLKFDLSLLGFNELKYKLSAFNITKSFATEKEIDDFTIIPKSGYWKDRLRQFFFHYNNIVEKEFSFNQNIFNKFGNLCIDGYWQSEKYFKSIEDVIRKDFCFNMQFSKEVLSLSKQIEITNSVCIHVRRGDYVTNPEAKNFHGVCDIYYFKHAINIIETIIPNSYFYIFSDDLKWCHENFKNLNHPYLIVENYTDVNHSVSDFFLMTKCKNFIISNSSFSWWGAWLSVNPEKIVIAPSRWFANEEMQLQTQDLLPEKWIKI